MSLPKACSFPQLKSSAVASVSTQYAIPVSNSGSTFNESSSLTFLIPCAQRSTFIDPSNTYLRFRCNVTLTGGTTPTASLHAYDVISSISLASSEGGPVQETVSNYNLLHSALRDICSDVSNSKTSDSLMIGANPALVRSPLALTTTYADFAIPLVSILGTLSGFDTYLASMALQHPLALTINLASAAQAIAVTGGATPSYNITNTSLNMTYVTVSDTAMSSINQMSGGVYQWNSKKWFSGRSVHPAQQATNTVTITAKAASVSTVIVAMRPSAAEQGAAYYSVQDRIKNYLSTYQFRIGSTFVNSRPVDCSNTGLDAYMQLRRCYASPSAETRPTLCDSTSWVKNAATAVSSSAVPGSFLIAQEMSPFANIPALLSGTDTFSNSPQLDLVFDSTNLANVVAANVDWFMEADCVCSIRDGQLTIQS